MHRVCDLEVEVNEEHSFLLCQKPLATYSAKMCRIFKRAGVRDDHHGLPRILLHDFPGGNEGFELATRFCYNKGRLDITHTNVSVLRCVGEYLEMTEVCARGNLVKMTEMHLQSLGNDWDSNLAVLRGCESVLRLAEKTHIVQRCADALAWRVVGSIEDMSPLSSSPDSSRFHSGSFSRRSYSPVKASSKTWWFSDVASLSVCLMDRVVKALIYNDVNNKMLARFLTHYLRSALPVNVYNGVSAKMDQEGCQKGHVAVFQVIIDLLFHLERGSISCRFLFSMLRVANNLSVSKSCKRQLEKMIGSQLDEVNLDSILLPLYPRSDCLYDVDLVIRLAEHFFKEQETRGALHERNARVETAVETGATRVGDLIDTYLAEIAPDTSLKAHKFRRLAQALPASARWTHDGLYKAVDCYLQAHGNLMETEVASLCKVIDASKLSLEACKHVAKNHRLPAKFVLSALAFQQNQLRDCLLVRDRLSTRQNSMSGDLSDLSSDAQLKNDLDQISTKVAQLESTCKSLRSDVSKYNRAARRLLC